jgi:hypothetical protein
MEEFIEILMSSYTINQAGQLEYSIAKTIESWDMIELFTVITISNKGV